MTDDAASNAAVYRPELPGRPEPTPVWDAADELAEDVVLSSARPSHTKRELWYCPTVTIWDAHRADLLFEEHGIERVCDLGSGDCRFSLWCARQGYDVVAYELNPDLVEAVRERFPLDDMELRERDYYEDYDDLVAPDAAVVAFGGTNELPHPPETGLGIEGYGEIGIRAYHDGEVVAAW